MTPELSERMTTIRHRWTHLALVHWRCDPAALRDLVPPGTRPDLIDGSAWVGVVGYRFDATALGRVPAPGCLGRLRTVAVEIPTVDRAGRRGVAYRTLEVDNPAAVLAARTVIGAPYRPARVGMRATGDSVEFRSRRAASRTGLRLAVTARSDARPDAVSSELATRAGIHVRHLGVTAFWRREHLPLVLRPGTVDRVGGDLDAAVGVPGLLGRRPDSVALCDGTDVRYSWGGVVRR